MTDIEVTRETAFTAAADLDALAGTLPKVQGFMNQYVYSDMEGGFFLTDAGDSINELRLALYQLTRDPQLVNMRIERLPVRGGAQFQNVVAAEFST